jgi:NCS1 nucleoside transporter family
MASDVVTIPELDNGVETHGIERVSPETRAHVRIFDNFTMWLSANLVISTIALGTISTFFGLGFWDGLAVIIIFNVLGTLPVAFFSTLGPKLGLRQMTISRFSFGWVGGIIMALFNVAATIGWSAVNVIVGGQLVVVLSKGAIPIWAGIALIAVLTTVVSIYGYKYVHGYERWAWIPVAIMFAILFIVALPHFQLTGVTNTATAELVGFITFGGAVYGFATGWSSYAADYNVNQPENTPSSRVFWLTFLGVVIPCILLETLGLLFTTALGSVTAWNTAFGKFGNVGALLAAVVNPLGGFGTLLLVLLALSVIANNIPNDYSLGLSMQVLGKAFQRVKRYVWTLIGAVVYVTIAIIGSANFAGTLQNFLLLIAYWLGPWAIILVIEHFVFRRGKYNVDDWNTASKLPIGWAAIVSMVIGLLGVYLGAAQSLFTGPVAKLLSGTDVGFELGLVLAGIAYLILRRIELNSTQR